MSQYCNRPINHTDHIELTVRRAKQTDAVTDEGDLSMLSLDWQVIDDSLMLLLLQLGSFQSITERLTASVSAWFKVESLCCSVQPNSTTLMCCEYVGILYEKSTTNRSNRVSWSSCQPWVLTAQQKLAFVAPQRLWSFLNAKKSVGGHVKKSITSSFFNRITFYLAVRCRRFR